MNLKKYLTSFFIVSLFLSSAPAETAKLSTAPADLSPKVFNPKPMPDDLVLPLPCNSKDYFIVFRKVYTNDAKDTDITHSCTFTEGSSDDSRALMQSERQCAVRGGFKDEKGYFFYIQKYEMTQGQADAIKDGKCKATPSKTDALPKVNISFADAQKVAEAFSDYLQSIPETPSMGKEKANATLPVECFWSFAQRGGLAVSKKDLEAQRPVLPGKLQMNDYAWFYGADSSNGRLQLIGRKSPNALGLFDMLGNAQEYMLEAFQATGIEGLAGQRGGSTVRGGSYLTNESELSSSLRSEKKRYTNNKPTVSKDTGFRLMLNVSVTQDMAHQKEATQTLLQKRAIFLSRKDKLTKMKNESSDPKLTAKYEEEIKKLEQELLELETASKDSGAVIEKLKNENKSLNRRNLESKTKSTPAQIFLYSSLSVVTLVALVLLLFFIISKRAKALQNRSKLLLENEEKAYADYESSNVQKKPKSRFSKGFVDKQ